jgi:hypothetical protein
MGPGFLFVNYTDWRGALYAQFPRVEDVERMVVPLLQGFADDLNTVLPFDDFRLERRADASPYGREEPEYLLRNAAGDAIYRCLCRGETDSSMLVELVRTPEHEPIPVYNELLGRYAERLSR